MWCRSFTGKYDRRKDDKYNFVNPVIAAFFIPKNRFLDERVIIANIGNIIKTLYDKKPIMNKPEFDLWTDISSDPNVAACMQDKDNIMGDLKFLVLNYKFNYGKLSFNYVKEDIIMEKVQTLFLQLIKLNQMFLIVQISFMFMMKVLSFAEYLMPYQSVQPLFILLHYMDLLLFLQLLHNYQWLIHLYYNHN